MTDVVLPGLGDGIGLAETLHARWPYLPVVLTTGYTERQPPAWATLLMKPYDTGVLVETVRRELDASREALVAWLADRDADGAPNPDGPEIQVGSGI